MKTLLIAILLILITGCTGGAPVYYNPNAAMMLDYSARMLAPQYSNSYIRPTVHTTCINQGPWTNCNSY